MPIDEKPEIALLKTMWHKKALRKTSLIVPYVQYSLEDANGTLNNEHWKYRVTYAFREALDISYEQRMKNKKPYMIWTQGPIINFKTGDVLKSIDNSSLLQVRDAIPMCWDVQSDQMKQGMVLYTENGKIQDACTQMKFLEVLIYGIL